MNSLTSTLRLLLLGLSLWSCKPNAADTETESKRFESYHLDEVRTLPPLIVEVPAYVRPFQITDPPALYMFENRDPLDEPLRASIAIQPAEVRGGPPHCGLVGIPVAEPNAVREVEHPSDDVAVYRCRGESVEGVIVDQHFEGSQPFHCVAIWRWKSEDPMPPRWRQVGDDIEATCGRIELAD